MKGNHCSPEKTGHGNRELAFGLPLTRLQKYKNKRYETFYKQKRKACLNQARIPLYLPIFQGARVLVLCPIIIRYVNINEQFFLKKRLKLSKRAPLSNPTRECGVAPTATDTIPFVARGNVRRVPIGSWRRAMAADDRHHDTRHIGPSTCGVRRVPTGSWRRAMAAGDTYHTRYHAPPPTPAARHRS